MQTPGGPPPADVDEVGAVPVQAQVSTEAVDTVTGDAGPQRSRASSLFGRDLLYVGVLSLQLVSATVVSPIMAHVLPGTEFGHLSSAIALYQVLNVLCLLGLDQAMVLMRASTGSDVTARGLVAVGLVQAALLSTLALLTSRWWGPAIGFREGDPLVGYVVAWSPFGAGLLMVSALLLSQDRLRAFAVVNVLSSVGGQVVGLAVVLFGPTRTASAFALGNLATLVAGLVLGVVLVRPRLRGITEVRVARRALTLGLPLMVGGLAVFVLNASDRLVVQSILGAEEAGRYQIAYVIGNLAVLLLGMTDAAFLPRIAALREESARWAAIALARNGLLRIVAPVILGITLGSPLVLTVVAPADFRPQELHPVVFLVALAVVPVLLGVSWVWELMTRERTRRLAASAIVAAVANLALNLVLVPAWGLLGAAAATVAAFAVESVGYRLSVPRGVSVPHAPWRLLLVVFGAAAVSAATLWLPHSPTWNVVQFALAACCLPWLYYAWRDARSALEEGVTPGPVASGTAAPAAPDR